jgi:two-component system response regulator NreC
MSKALSVYIIDDHPVIKDGLPPLLEKDRGIRVIGSAPDVSTALKHLKYLTPDVILLDVSMPQLSGLDAIGLIKEELPKVRILMFSMHEKEAYVYRALSAGALGYVVKGSPLNELITAIETVGEGGYYLSPGLEKEVLQTYLTDRQAKNEPEGGYDQLTEREQQVFRLMVAGSTTQQISETLELSTKTVEKHRTSINKKLGTGNLVEMVKYAVQLGIIDPTTWSS